MTDISLEFIARQLDRLIQEVEGLRDEVRVQGAMIMRLDTSHATLLEEVRATHRQIARMNDRIRKLEDTP
jgi:hypothetical protein